MAYLFTLPRNLQIPFWWLTADKIISSSFKFKITSYAVNLRVMLLVVESTNWIPRYFMLIYKMKFFLVIFRKELDLNCGIYNYFWDYWPSILQIACKISCKNFKLILFAYAIFFVFAKTFCWFSKRHFIGFNLKKKEK